ncbi:uncharacterized protein Z520_03298 [Fonsecaea multimorphosa CBS 102226]|uniref:EthD domain-containing protein n=1 Tax=Fonsecaea multimorphosa CBS 102226 TaxID=1442371 RepID=A0A0D2KC07_9EURO|nr:uncharacterized protein Z520_03298 [Fonsecaea multimorphosa CBS 102226]KIY00635.1 hypothetical protein Z520_03298 [Fonsecaea multimorphosa CBS 102226]OAL19025.1 hypothetical protein AYO22_10354 [Fonsecaea multimorphosa]
MATKHRFYRITIFVNRVPELSEDEFHKHWSTTHRQLAEDLLVKYGIAKYRQYHTPSALLPEAEAKCPGLDKVKELGFDGAADFIMADIESFYKFRQDPYYSSHVDADARILFDWNSARWTVGWEEVYVKDGRVVEMPDGED